jgi:glycosyltransferase involved in cell wall biosynthesis
MNLVVFSHKSCWRSGSVPNEFETDGGFPFQMQALSELFETTTLVVPGEPTRASGGGSPLRGNRLSVVPLTPPSGRGIRRKLAFPFWVIRNAAVLLREASRADAIHAPVPGDVGTIGMFLAFLLRKPLFVRYCGNWLAPRTAAERFWKWTMERYAGGRNVVLATGGAQHGPSGNPAIQWIFATALTDRMLDACGAGRFGPPREQTRLVIACRQEREKGTGTVIESLPLILKDFPEASLDVIGGGSALSEFKALASSLGVSRRTRFHGKVDHASVVSLLKQADLFCYPTASEGFPKVVVEALACGLPVLTTRVSVLPQLIGVGCGMLLEEATPEAVARGVVSCLEDNDRYRAMSARAIETARQYSLERWRDAVGQILQDAWGPLRAQSQSHV